MISEQVENALGCFMGDADTRKDSGDNFSGYPVAATSPTISDELTRLREENRVLREGLEDIADDVASVSQAYAETALAAADKIRGGV